MSTFGTPVRDARVRELRDMPYPDYLLTPEWQETRQTALHRAGRTCQVCAGSEALHVHHRTYIRRGAEQPDDLTVLCNGCHSLFHENRKLAEEGRADPALADSSDLVERRLYRTAFALLDVATREGISATARIVWLVCEAFARPHPAESKEVYGVSLLPVRVASRKGLSVTEFYEGIKELSARGLLDWRREPGEIEVICCKMLCSYPLDREAQP